MQKSENEYKAEITRLETDIKNKDTEKALELTTALSKVESEKNSTIAELNAQIKSKDEAIAYYKDLKSRLSTKMVGESLEPHSETLILTRITTQAQEAKVTLSTVNVMKTVWR